MASKATKANTSAIVAIIFFVIFSILAILIGVVDLMNPIYPWGLKLPVLGQIAFMVGILSLVAASLLWKLKRLGARSRVFAKLNLRRKDLNKVSLVIANKGIKWKIGLKTILPVLIA